MTFELKRFHNKAHRAISEGIARGTTDVISIGYSQHPETDRHAMLAALRTAHPTVGADQPLIPLEAWLDAPRHQTNPKHTLRVPDTVKSAQRYSIVVFLIDVSPRSASQLHQVQPHHVKAITDHVMLQTRDQQLLEPETIYIILP